MEKFDQKINEPFIGVCMAILREIYPVYFSCLLISSGVSKNPNLWAVIRRGIEKKSFIGDTSDFPVTSMALTQK